MKTSDIAKKLSGCADSVCKYLMPDGEKIDNDWCVGDISGSKGKSLKISLSGESAGAWLDFAGDDSGNLVTLWQRVHNLDEDQACREAEEWLGVNPSERRTASHWEKIQKTMRRGTATEIKTLADLRRLSVESIQLATEAGQLWFDNVYDLDREYPAWILTDSSRKNAQARRLDGQLWPKKNIKAKTLQGAKAPWPVGACDANGHDIVLTEGGPDLLAAWHCIWLNGVTDRIYPVAIFGASNKIPSDAIEYFSGKRVYIPQHNDSAGLLAGNKWVSQLTKSAVHIEDLCGCKDLNDLVIACEGDEHPVALNQLFTAKPALPVAAPADDDWGDAIPAATQNPVVPLPAAKPALPTARPITSYAYPSEDDPNILIGKDDYLGKGGGMLFISHAGAGKSSWIMDACMMWGLGNPWMGIKCARPLKSLIIQAEDSDRYVGKIYTSFAHQNKLTEAQVSSLSENCVIVRLKGVAGQSFYSELKRLTDLHQPDLVIINPLYLYAEGDIGRAEFAQPFLLNLDHINKAEKFAYILIHHTGKPSAKGTNGKRAETEDWESAYMGFGSSYLANWPRCTALLEPVAGVQRRFTIKLGKGGYNAGVTKTVTQGVGTRQEPTTKIHIKHSDERMDVNGIDKPVFYWEECNPEEVQQTEPQDQKRGPKRKHSIGKYLPLIPTRDEAPKSFDQIQKAAHNMTGIPRNSFRDLIDYETEMGNLLRSHDPVLGPCYKQS